MGRYTDHAPVGQTCPLIDNVIAFIQSVDWAEDEKDLEDESKKAVIVMEEIRKANSALREWGNESVKERDNYEEERDDFEKECDNLKDDISHLNKTITELEKQIYELENQLQDAN